MTGLCERVRNDRNLAPEQTPPTQALWLVVNFKTRVFPIDGWTSEIFLESSLWLNGLGSRGSGLIPEGVSAKPDAIITESSGHSALIASASCIPVIRGMI